MVLRGAIFKLELIEQACPRATSESWVMSDRFNRRRASNDFRRSPTSGRTVAQIRSVAKGQEQKSRPFQRGRE
jgi:hypothetical protein